MNDSTKVGPWEAPELRELVAAFDELGRATERLVDSDGNTPPDNIENLTRALCEVTKALHGVVLTSDPKLGPELISSVLSHYGVRVKP